MSLHVPIFPGLWPFQHCIRKAGLHSLTISTYFPDFPQGNRWLWWMCCRLFLMTLQIDRRLQNVPAKRSEWEISSLTVWDKMCFMETTVLCWLILSLFSAKIPSCFHTCCCEAKLLHLVEHMVSWTWGATHRKDFHLQIGAVRKRKMAHKLWMWNVVLEDNTYFFPNLHSLKYNRIF